MPRLFIALIFFFGAVILGFFYLKPEWNTFQNIRKETQALRDASAEFDELAQNRDALVQSINRVSKEDLDRINRALPQGPKSADFLVFLESSTLRDGLSLRHADLTATQALQAEIKGQPKPGGVALVEKRGSIRELPLELDVNGSYESFKAFLKDLETNLPLVDVQTISFSAANRGETADFSIKAKTYYQ